MKAQMFKTMLKIQTHSVDSTHDFICATVRQCQCVVAASQSQTQIVAQIKPCVESTLWV